MQFYQRYTFKAISQDIASDKRPSNTHKNIVNFETYFTDKGLSLKVSKGTSTGIPFGEMQAEAADLPSTQVYIIGHETIGKRLFVWVTDNKGEPNQTSYDAIVEVKIQDTSVSLELKKQGNWGLSTLYPVSSVGIKESSKSSKLYWVDSINQARYCNVDDGDVHGNVDFTIYTTIPGITTAFLYNASALLNAVVRYGFTQYNLGGSESKITPLSSPVNISPENGSAKVICNQMSPDLYSNYRIYRLMWKTYHSAPEISIVDEGIIPESGRVEFVDDGGTFIAGISIEEFIDIGSDWTIPTAIESKKQYLFLANYKNTYFDIDDDVRAFSYEGGIVSLGPDIDIPEASPETLPDIYFPNKVAVTSQLNLSTASRGTAAFRILNEVPDPNPYIYYPTYANNTIEQVYVNGWLDTSTNPGVIIPRVLVRRIRRLTPTTYEYVDGDTGTFVNLGDVMGFQLLEPNLGFEISTGEIGHVAPSQEVYVEADVYVGHDMKSTGKGEMNYSDIPDINGYVYTVNKILNATVKVQMEGSQYTAYLPVTITNTTSSKVDFEVDLTGLIVPNTNETFQRSFVATIDVSGKKNQILGGGINLKDANGVITKYSSPSQVPLNHDAINPDYDNNYLVNPATTELGASGVLTELKFVPGVKPAGKNTKRYFKAGELYRIGIKFYDGYGRATPAKWVVDLKVPYVDVSSDTNYHYELKGKINYMPAGAVAYQFLVVPRKESDKSILFQGVVQPLAKYVIGPGSENLEAGVFAFPNMQEFKGDGTNKSDNQYNWFSVSRGVVNGEDWPKPATGDPDFTTLNLYDTKFSAVFTPEVLLTNYDRPANKIRTIGVVKIDAFKDRTWIEFHNNYSNYKLTKGIKSIVFDMKAEFPTDGTSELPLALYDDLESNDNRKNDAAVWMYSRTADKFFKSFQEEFNIISCKYLDYDSSLPVGTSAVTSTVSFPDFAGKVNEKYKLGVSMEMSPYFVIEGQTDWVTSGPLSVPFSLFGQNLDPSFGTSLGDRGFPVIDVMTTAANQYNGDTFAAKQSNIYVDASESSSTAGAYLELWGDIFFGLYALPHTTSARHFAEEVSANVFDYNYILLESEVCIDYANSRLKNTNGDLNASIANPLQIREVKTLMEYDTVFSQMPNSVITKAKPFNFIDVDEYLVRVTASLPKVIGETIDNWTKINFGSYIDLESQFGPISSLNRFKDNVISFQTHGIAVISILPTAQTTTQQGTINLGKGKVLDDYTYIKVNSGCSNKQAIAVFEDKLFFIDTVNKTLNSIENDSVSTLVGFNSVTQAHMTSEVEKYIVNGGAGFVWINDAQKEVYFKFSNSFPVLVFNYAHNVFTHSRTYEADYFISYGRLQMAGKNSNIYLLDKGSIGNYFGETKSSLIQMVCEPVPKTDKVFDAIQIMKKGESNLNNILITSPTRTSGVQPITWRSKFDIHTMHLPRVENSRDRWRERVIDIDLEYTDTKELSIDEIILKFSVKKM